ncbi:MAG: hypothetical protein NC183_06965 [Corallococcus sp.]|nr:hypothetical protein [Corallococcus sp.]
MKAKLNFKWKKGWETVDVAKGGYAETVYEYFDYVPDVLLLKSKADNVWYIGNLQKGETPSMGRIIYDEETARKELDGVKRFIQSEIASRHRFKQMNKTELEDWILEFGRNDYVGESLYLHTAIDALQSFNKKELEM